MSCHGIIVGPALWWLCVLQTASCVCVCVMCCALRWCVCAGPPDAGEGGGRGAQGHGPRRAYSRGVHSGLGGVLQRGECSWRVRRGLLVLIVYDLG